MSSGASLTFDGLNLRGASRAGDQSWYRVDPPGLALDVGRGAEPLVGAPWIFVSHGHLDHSLGLPWVLSQRRLQGLAPATVFCPSASAADLREFVRVAGRLDGEDLESEIVGLEPGEGRILARGLRLQVFASHHTAPALGCHLIRKQTKLRSELVGSSTAEVAALKRDGAQVTVDSEFVWLTYCGDTGAEVFSSEPRLFEARILLIECTFLGAATRAHGTRFGHLHLADFIEHESRFANEAIVLSHLSRRHRLDELRSAVDSELPGLAPRIHFLVGRGEAN